MPNAGCLPQRPTGSQESRWAKGLTLPAHLCCRAGVATPNCRLFSGCCNNCVQAQLEAKHTGCVSLPRQRSMAADSLRPYHQFPLRKRFLQLVPIAFPPFGLEYFDHDFAHKNVVASDALRAFFPEALGWRPRIQRYAAEPIAKVICNAIEGPALESFSSGVIQRKQDLHKMHTW
jgi:hypothetical protein